MKSRVGSRGAGKMGCYQAGWYHWREDFQLLGGNVVKELYRHLLPKPHSWNFIECLSV